MGRVKDILRVQSYCGINWKSNDLYSYQMDMFLPNKHSRGYFFSGSFVGCFSFFCFLFLGVRTRRHLPGIVEVELLSHAKWTTFRKLVVNFFISLGFSLVWWNTELIGIQLIDFVLVAAWLKVRNSETQHVTVNSPILLNSAQTVVLIF